MELLPSFTALALPATLVLLLSWLAMRLRQRSTKAAPPSEALDTVGAWPPTAVRVLTIDERQAYDLLRRALPGFLVLAQVPLARFLRVPSRHSHAEWMQRVGSLNADLLLCDAGSKVLAVIDIRAPQESERSRRRHERMARVLRAAGIQVFTWCEGQLPHIAEVRHALTPLMGPAADGIKPGGSQTRPGPLIPVAEMSELLADGDRAALEAALDAAMEPVPSGFYEEPEQATAGARR